MLIGMTLVRWCMVVLAGLSAAIAQPDSHIITAHATRAALNSVRLLPDGTTIYSDAYGVYCLSWCCLSWCCLS